MTNDYPVAILLRSYHDTNTTGILSFGNNQIDTVELKNNENKPGESCVLEGDFLCTYQEMHDHPGHFHYKLEDKNGRTGCFIHYINMDEPNPEQQLKGCIGSSQMEIAVLETWLPCHAPFVLKIRS